MTSEPRSNAKGFSLVELLTAMLITLIVSGAIYGLLAGGQNAFRREPELTDRQQSIRVGMDLIMRDVANAGAGMPSFMQTFTQGLNACSGCPDGGAPMGLDSQVTDELELITNDSARDNEPVCDEPGSSPQIRLIRTSNGIPVPSVVFIIMDDGTWTLRNVVSDANDQGASGGCTGGEDHTRLNFNTGQDQTNPPVNVNGSLCNPNGWGVGSVTGQSPCNPVAVSFPELVRYRVRNGADGVPVLQRSTSSSPGVWQVVARGIEDLQVQYTQASGTVTTGAPGAPQVLPNNFGTVITEAQVTLASRSEAQNIQGMTTNPSARTAIRGRLVSRGTPRSALIVLTQQSPNPLWR